MLRYLAEHQIFDAMEVLGGQEPGSMESNLQIAFWNDMRADGIYMPIVGCDDAHTRHMTWNSLDNCFNMAWTVIFAKEPSFDGFAESIRGGYSAAVDNYDGAERRFFWVLRYSLWEMCCPLWQTPLCL